MVREDLITSAVRLSPIPREAILTNGRYLVCRGSRHAHILHADLVFSPARSVRCQRASREAHCLSAVEESHTRRGRPVARTSSRRSQPAPSSFIADISTTKLCIQPAPISSTSASLWIPASGVLATTAAARVRIFYRTMQADKLINGIDLPSATGGIISSWRR